MCMKRCSCAMGTLGQGGQEILPYMASIRTSDIMPMVNVFIEPNWCEDHAELELPVGLGSGADGVKDEDCDAVVKVGMLVSEEPPVITEPVIGMGVLMVSEADVTRF